MQWFTLRHVTSAGTHVTVTIMWHVPSAGTHMMASGIWCHTVSYGESWGDMYGFDTL